MRMQDHEKLHEFLRQFYYNEIMLLTKEDKPALVIDFNLLDRFDPVMAEKLLEQPADVFESFAKAISLFDVGLKMPVRVKNIPEKRNIRLRNLRAEHISRLIVTDVIVKSASEVKPQIETAIFECPECMSRIEVEQEDGQLLQKPGSCSCGRRGDFPLVDKKMIDYRWLKGVEPFEVTTGEQPSELAILLKEDLTTPRMQKRTDPGNRLRIVGILKELPKRIKGKMTTKLDTYIEANYVESTEIEFEDLTPTPEDEARILQLAHDPDIYNKLKASIAPGIYGFDEVKEALVLQLFGGVAHRLPDNTHIRGNIHILLTGDPGVGKSLAGSSKILHNSDKGPEFTELGAMVDRMIEEGNARRIGDSEICTGNRHNIRILTLNRENRRLEWKPVSAFIRHASPKTLLKIKTESGREVTATRDHSFVTRSSEGEIVAARGTELGIGSFLPVPLGMHNPILEFADTGFQEKAGGGRALPPKIRLDRDFGVFLGLFIAGGSIQQDCVRIASASPEEREPAKRFAKSSGLSWQEDGESVKIASRELAEYLKSHCYCSKPGEEVKSPGAARKAIPGFCFFAPREHIGGLLSGLFSGCGSLPGAKLRKGQHRGGLKLRAVAESKDLAYGLLELLALAGIFATVRERQHEQGADGSYEVAVAGGDAQRLLAMIKNGGKPASIASRPSESDASGLPLLKAGTALQEKAGPVPCPEAPVHGSIVWDRIASIEETASDQKYVYDLSVDGNETFVANNLVVHNSVLLKLASSVMPRGKYVSGSGVTGAGLTASVRKEELLGHWVLEAGALILCNKGLIAIDEFDKISKDDQIAMHEAMSVESYHGSTLLTLSSGERRPIREIVEELFLRHRNKIKKGHECYFIELERDEAPELLVTDFRRIFPAKAIRVSKHKAPGYFVRVELENGRSVTVTPGHPFFVLKGLDYAEMPVEELKPGMWLPVPRELPIAGSIGPGVQAEEEHPPAMHIAFPEMSPQGLCEPPGIPAEPSAHLQSPGTVMLKNRGEKLPPSAFACSRKEAAALLRAMFDGDGSACMAGDGGLCIKYATSSRMLATDVMDLLLRFGITSRLEVSHQPSGQPAFRVVITGAGNLRAFLRHIGFSSAEKNAVIESRIRTKASRASLSEKLPLGADVARLLGALKLSRKAAAGETLAREQAQKILRAMKARLSDVSAALQTIGQMPEAELQKLRKRFRISCGEIGKRLGKPCQAISYRERKGFPDGTLEPYRHALGEALQDFLKLEGEVARLDRIASGQLFPCRIRSIERIPSRTEEWAYDVSVPGEVFVSEGMVLHNTVSIAKASIVATLPAQTAVLAGANPKFGRFDSYRPIGEQIDIPETLLSVAPEEPIIFRENGVINVDTISSFVDRLCAGRESVPVEADGIEVPAFNKDMKLEWWPVRYVFRHKTKLPMYRLLLSSGRSVTVTRGHSVFTLRDGELCTVPSDRLKPGDWLAIPKRLPGNSSRPKAINLAAEFLKLPEELTRDIFLHNVPEKAIRRLKISDPEWKNGRKLPLAFGSRLTPEELRACTLKYKDGAAGGVPVEIKAGPELCRLLGYYIAGGSMSASGPKEHLISFEFRNKDKALIRDASAIVKRLFDHDAACTREKGRNSARMDVANKIIWMLFEHVLKVSKGAKGVPGIIWNLGGNCQKEFLKAFNACGCCARASERLVSDLLYLLLMNGIVASSHRPVSNGARLADGRVPLEPFRAVLQLAGSRRYSRAFHGKKRSAKYITPALWKSRISGPLIKARLERLRLLEQPMTAKSFAAKIYKVASPDRARVEFARNYLKSLCRRGLAVRSGSTMPQAYSISAGGRKVLGCIALIERLLHGDLGFVRVRDIKELPPAEGYVYDVSAPGHENFVAGSGGVLCHNSRFDLKFALRDLPNKSTDERLADHIISSRITPASITPEIDTEFLRKYLAYARKITSVELTKEAADALKAFYVEMRGKSAEGSVAITLRQYEALIRLAEASAKVRLDTNVRIEDAERAIRLMKFSLQQLGYDFETGAYDIDRAEGGMAAAQRSKRVKMLEAIEALQKAAGGKEVPVDDIAAEAETIGISEVDARQLIEKMKQEGLVFEPKPGYIRKL